MEIESGKFEFNRFIFSNNTFAPPSNNYYQFANNFKYLINLYGYDNSGGSFVNCNILNNNFYLDSDNDYGNSIINIAYSEQPSNQSIKINNCILDRENEMGVPLIYVSNGNLDVTYSNLVQGANIINCSVSNASVSIDENTISENPLFVDADNGDFNLQSGSPCIDAGDPSIIDEDGTVSDMGAFAYFHDYVLLGCMDSSACNFNDNATHENGSCEFTSCVGCSDPTAQNYDDNVTIDDGSCIFGPTILSIYDVPEDQGGYVFVNWEAINLDSAPNEEILKYSVWRYIPNQRGWEFLDYVDAYYFEEYSYVAPTINTSFGDNIENTDYKVLAHTANQWEYYESPVFSGYSIDNLAPDTVQEFTVLVEENYNSLSWLEGEVDIDYYNIYKNGQLISQVSDMYYIDDNLEYGQSIVYEIDAVDIHQNQGQSVSSDIIYSAIAGDLNLDQELNVIDIIFMVNLSLDIIDLSDFYLWSGDVNYDGSINVLDIIILVNWILDNDIPVLGNFHNNIN